jgi:uncharacterized repeat protein (TIGR03803 family)
LIEVKGTLYGTTGMGGLNGAGTVFSISTTGTEKVLHSFGSGTDGDYPLASLVDVKGTPYGTTWAGGIYGGGTVFNITTSGTEQVVHNFEGGADGDVPWASLIDVKGTLYGTTYVGGGTGCGGTGCGTVYSISTSGKERVLHSFGSGSDGQYPRASLLDVKDTLYGTTFGGGNYQAGTIFTIGTTGKERVLYTFDKGYYGYEAREPRAGLIDVKRTLYGTTWEGGECDGYGTVFSITTSGAEQVLHAFGCGNDGQFPVASPINVRGTLYGTTYGGGAYGTLDSGGTVFSVSTGGTEQVLHSFGSGSDGSEPYASLIDVNGTLYGTTYYGGTYGGGTVFALRLNE